MVKREIWNYRKRRDHWGTIGKLMGVRKRNYRCKGSLGGSRGVEGGRGGSRGVKGGRGGSRGIKRDGGRSRGVISIQ